MTNYLNGLDQRLGHPAQRVGRGAVHLGGVLAAEGAAAVRAPAAVGVHDDLAARQAGVAVGAANDEAARGVQVVHGLRVQQVRGHDLVDHLLAQVLLDLLVGDLVVVLRGDHDGVHAQGRQRAAHGLVLHGHLRLAVGAHPGAGAVLAHLGELVANAVGQQVREGHGLLSLVRGVAEHDALVAGANLLGGLGLGLLAKHALRNVGGLRLQRHEHVARGVVEALGLVVVANVLHRLAHHLLVVHLGLGGDLAKHHHHARLGGRLAGHATARKKVVGSV